MKDSKGNVILCDYGCGQEAKFTLKNGKHCCSQYWTKCPKIRQKNKNGINKAYKEGRINQKEIYKNKSQEAKDSMNWAKGKLLFDPNKLEKEQFIGSEMILKLCQYGKINKEYKCEQCGITEWNGKYIRLEVHHIDGNHSNNKPENLMLLCPNCHSQTKNYRNRGTTRWLTKEQVIDLIINELPKYHGDIKEMLSYVKVKNKSFVLEVYIDLIKNKNKKLLEITQNKNSEDSDLLF